MHRDDGATAARCSGSRYGMRHAVGTPREVIRSVRKAELFLGVSGDTLVPALLSAPLYVIPTAHAFFPSRFIAMTLPMLATPSPRVARVTPMIWAQSFLRRSSAALGDGFSSFSFERLSF